MQLEFNWYNLFCLACGVIALWMGIRDLQGKDPLIHTFFNQYDRDPEYRAMWQKKNGVWEICNSILLCSNQLLFRYPTICSRIYIAAIIVDIIYLVLYEAWEHSAD